MSNAAMEKRALHFPAATFAEHYANNGLVHVKNGVTPGFVEYSLGEAEARAAAEVEA